MLAYSAALINTTAASDCQAPSGQIVNESEQCIFISQTKWAYLTLTLTFDLES